MPNDSKISMLLFLAFAIVLMHAFIPHHHHHSEAVHSGIFHFAHNHGSHHHDHDHQNHEHQDHEGHSHPQSLSDVFHDFEFFRAADLFKNDIAITSLLFGNAVVSETIASIRRGFERSPDTPPNRWLMARSIYLPSEFYPNVSLLAPPAAV